MTNEQSHLDDLPKRRDTTPTPTVRDVFCAIRQGSIPREGKYLSYEDGFIDDRLEAHLTTAEDAKETLRALDNTVTARIVRVHWTEEEVGELGTRVERLKTGIAERLPNHTLRFEFTATAGGKCYLDVTTGTIGVVVAFQETGPIEVTSLPSEYGADHDEEFETVTETIARVVYLLNNNLKAGMPT